MMTPGEFYAYVEGYTERLQIEHKTQNVAIYNLASLVRTAVWGKHFPKYESVFKEKKSQMTDEQMYAQAMALTEMLGGKME